MKHTALFSKTLKLAQANPELRKHLLPVLTAATKTFDYELEVSDKLIDKDVAFVIDAFRSAAKALSFLFNGRGYYFERVTSKSLLQAEIFGPDSEQFTLYLNLEAEDPNGALEVSIGGIKDWGLPMRYITTTSPIFCAAYLEFLVSYIRNRKEEADLKNKEKK